MKKILIVFALSFLIVSCSEQNKHKFEVYVSNGDGFDMTRTIIYCDSATMISKNKAVVYVDGIKSVIIADNILINMGYD